MKIFTNQEKRNYTRLNDIERGGTFQHETHQYMRIDPYCHGIHDRVFVQTNHVLCVNIKHGSCRTLQRDLQVLKTDAECHITIEE